MKNSVTPHHIKNLKISATSRKIAAFTLIELLVVIAIIAILAAILFPVFARARENARRSSCQSNLKQIALAYIQYTQDYDEFSPMLSTSFVAGGSNRSAIWAQLVQPYAKSTQVFQCPSDEGTDVHRGMGVPGTSSYNYNARDFGFVEPFHLSYMASRSVLGTGAQSVAKLISPSTVIGFADSGLRGSVTAPYIVPTSPKPQAYIMDYPSSPGGSTFEMNLSALVSGTNVDWGAPNPRHLETVVVGYMDGHVKALRIDKFYKPKVAGVPGCLSFDNETACS